MTTSSGGSPSLAEAEELASIRPDLDGDQIMSILDVPPGRVVGEAYRHLLELRLDRGPLGAAEAEARAPRLVRHPRGH